MNSDQLNRIIDGTVETIMALRKTKGKDYTRGDEDQLANFKRHAEALDLTPEQVWAVYAGKHWDAITSYCKRGQVESEPIEGRIDDAILYLLLLKGLVTEAREREAHPLVRVESPTPVAVVATRSDGPRVVPVHPVRSKPPVARFLDEGDGDAS